MPELVLETDDGKKTKIISKGKPVLLNLWASWCAPCLEEISEWSASKDRLDAAGLSVVLANVDGLEGGQGSREKAKKLAEGRKFPFTWGFPAAASLKRLVLMHHTNYAIKQDLKVPASFLIDGDGRLAAIYHGKVDLDQLLHDTTHLGDSRSERRLAAVPFPGRWDARRVMASADKRARAFLDAGEYEHAALLYKEALPHHPDHAPLLHEFGTCLQKLDRHGEVIPVLKKALALSKDPLELADIHTMLGRTYQRTGQRALVGRHFMKAVELNPGTFVAHYNLGAYYASSRNYLASSTQFRRALAADPKNPEAWNYLGVPLINMGKPDEAKSCFEKAVEVAPNHAQGYNNLGMLLERQGAPKKAEALYLKALEVDPAMAQARRNLDRVRSKSKRD